MPSQWLGPGLRLRKGYPSYPRSAPGPSVPYESAHGKRYALSLDPPFLASLQHKNTKTAFHCISCVCDKGKGDETGCTVELKYNEKGNTFLCSGRHTVTGSMLGRSGSSGLTALEEQICQKYYVGVAKGEVLPEPSEVERQLPKLLAPLPLSARKLNYEVLRNKRG